MKWIKLIRASGFILIINSVIFIIFNLTFVFFSPLIIKHMPLAFVQGINSCHRTFFQNNFKIGSEFIIFYGDSHAEGAGDEFLSGQDSYGLIPKVSKNSSYNFINFGRAGYGNISTISEGEACTRLIQRWTLARSLNNSTNRVLFLFYEGNDLNNNLRELTHTYHNEKKSAVLYEVRFLLPFLEFTFKQLRHFISLASNESITEDEVNSNNSKYPVTKEGIRLKAEKIQAAAIELSSVEINISLNILESSLDKLKNRYSKSELILIYIPSVASSYNFEGEIRTQSYAALDFKNVDAEYNNQRSVAIRSRVKELSKNAGWIFCDTTDEILAKTKKGTAVHGPLDFKHPNSEGYKTIVIACKDFLGK